jgi:hypothetical protein
MSDLEKDFERKLDFEHSAKLPEDIPTSPDEPVDLLPEYCEYKDEGCSLAPSCLNCPFPQCVLDLSRGEKKQAVNLRKAAIVRLLTLENKTLKDIADRLKVSQRTIIRDLKDSSR